MATFYRLRTVSEGFLRPRHQQLLRVAEQPEQMLALLFEERPAS